MGRFSIRCTRLALHGVWRSGPLGAKGDRGITDISYVPIVLASFVMSLAANPPSEIDCKMATL